VFRLGFPTSCPLDFYGAGEDNGSRGTDSLGGRHSNRTNSAPTPTTPHGFLQAGCPSCHPTNSIKALKARDVPDRDFHYLARTGIYGILDTDVRTARYVDS